MVLTLYWKGIVTELLWFLRGSTNIKYLLENNCHIWTGDAIKNYEKHNGEINGGPHTTKQEYFEDCVLNKEGFAEKWGSLGPIYGKQWRRWCTYPNEYGEYESNPIDQIQNSINLLKTDPDSRRNIVSAWNVGELDKMVLPPCGKS
jgi:thymidylate synthase